MAKRSFWAWGHEADEPTAEQMKATAEALAKQYNVDLKPVAPPRSADLSLRKPRITPPPAMADICASDDHDRAVHTYGRSFRDRIRAFNLDFPNPPDVVARPRNEQEVAAVLDWCSSAGHAAIPFGGGSSTVAGFEPPEGYDGIVTIDLENLNQVLEIDDISRAARIQGGTYGPALEDQLRPHGFTLRHYPQSFELSTLGGWIATRSGGHYATNQTHIDDMVESVRMVTPSGLWESRRLPGSGAGPSPDRMAIGSEGILGIITEAWMRIQARPVFRASAGVTFPTFAAGAEAARRVVQTKLWPANCRLLDPVEAAAAAGLDGAKALLLLGFESSDIPQGESIQHAVKIARDAGGTIADSAIRVSDGTGGRTQSDTGRQGAVGAWRDSFLGAPYMKNHHAGLGLVTETMETSITWERWPAMDRSVRAALHDALNRTCGGGSVSCRFTHVYTDGPAPYFTFEGMGRLGAELEMYAEIKQAASDAIMAAGGTITHHHAVGRLHRPWYDQQRPDLFARSLRAVKKTLDPNGVLNPGLLINV
ncbi:MAG: FAD-binding oxidoreductase [Chloroflexi bacterium]|nr:FAD-binding oxidoreductase [Chloroflexota bacterium]MDA1271748.1 FAD-binding oxidoreductase [Chloroflexota bacterium]